MVSARPPGESDAGRGRLARLAEAGHAHSIVSEVTRDPNPAPSHAYQRDPQSGAGNCTCGMAERHRRHPHEFMPTASRPDLCVCALPPEALPHQTRVIPPTEGGTDG